MANTYNSLHSRRSKGWGEIKIEIFIVFIPLLLIFLYIENNCITSTCLEIECDSLPKSFDGYKIVHLSDLHNKKFGKGQRYLIDRIEKANPDLIVCTGDLIDSRRHGIDNSISLMKECVDIAPVYYVTGNHEWRSEQFNLLKEALIETGVKILQDTHCVIEREDEKIYILGIDDPSRVYKRQWNEGEVLSEGIYEMEEDDVIREGIERAIEDIEDGEFKILLTHRPEKLHVYSEYDIDMVFAGHAHGGQVRLPFIGGIIAPNQGFFPQYTSGKHIYKNSTMVVSRGLGNSIIPQRLFNCPEIVIVTLRLL